MSEGLSVVHAFLLGEGPLQGYWFGEDGPPSWGKYWWRTFLRDAATPSIAPAAQTERDRNAARWAFFEEHAQSYWQGKKLIDWLGHDGVMKHGSRNNAIDAAMEDYRASLATRPATKD